MGFPIIIIFTQLNSDSKIQTSLNLLQTGTYKS